MRVILSGAVIVASLSALLAAPVLAQSVAAVGGPAENPPAGFSGQQYVDSRGCMFMRAGFGGQVSWVPRIGRDRKPLCGAVTPAQASARLGQEDSTAPMAAPMEANPDVGAPMETVASGMAAGRKTGVFAPIAVPNLDDAPAPRMASAQGYTAPRTVIAMPALAAPVANYAAAVSGGAGAGCPASAPVLQTLPLNTGGTVTVCTRGDGTATGWVSPNYASVGGAIRNVPGQQVGFGQFASANGYGGRVISQGMGQGVLQATAPAGRYVQTVIDGQPIYANDRDDQPYKAAWKDDRLNPNRGRGTAEGWAQQAQVWTQKVPAQSLSDIAAKKAKRGKGQAGAGQAQAVLTASTMSAQGVSQATGSGRIFVQVGTFGQPANAQNAMGRLAGLGLPVASAKGMRGGRQLVSVMAGPFGSAADAANALAAARGAGFGDAFIR